jgi:hypothetical protein
LRIRGYKVKIYRKLSLFRNMIMWFGVALLFFLIIDSLVPGFLGELVRGKK